MKTIAIYILIFLVSIAYNYETISYLSKKAAVFASSCEDDLNGQETDSESKESDEKSEKKDKLRVFISLHTSHTLVSCQMGSARAGDADSQNLSSDDYSPGVYSPPETDS